MAQYDPNDSWGKRAHFAAILCQVTGLNSYMYIPYQSVTRGALGSVILSVLTYATLGVPLLYMEYIVGQFTARDCLDVWKSHKFLSHLGYIQIFYQIYFIVQSHAINSAAMHYLLISFEDPIPYFNCGPWKSEDCDIARTNFTVSKNCVGHRAPYTYCDKLYLTYPEYQYWRYHILGIHHTEVHIAWRLLLASVLLCIIIYCSCFRRLRSIKRVLGFYCFYPTCGYVVLMLGSMVQKGIVLYYYESLDTDFSKFTEKFQFTGIIAEVLYGLNVGTGLSFNLASKASFRAPVYKHVVISIFISCIVCILGVCTTAMMSCPYGYEFSVKPGLILQDKLHFTFEKIPRLLHAYHSSSVWLIIFFSTVIVCNLSWQILMLGSLIEILAKRKAIVAKYASFVTLAIVITLCTVTLPLVSNLSYSVILEIRRAVRVVALLMVVIENIVFVLCYGLEKFCNDIHFMQDSQPKARLKVCWVITPGIVGYVFCMEVYYQYLRSKGSLGRFVGWWVLCGCLAWITLVPIGSLLVAACRKRFGEVVRLDPTWGPKCEVLSRSRGMFSAHAMTKEYLYRQYHLQAGITNRQRAANVRNTNYFSRSSTWTI